MLLHLLHAVLVVLISLDYVILLRVVAARIDTLCLQIFSNAVDQTYSSCHRTFKADLVLGRQKKIVILRKLHVIRMNMTRYSNSFIQVLTTPRHRAYNQRKRLLTYQLSTPHEDESAP